MERLFKRTENEGRDRQGREIYRQVYTDALWGPVTQPRTLIELSQS